MQGPIWVLNEAIEGIGREFPQHQSMSHGYDYQASDSVHKLPHDALPGFKPNFETVVIHGHARLTDLLSSAPLRPGYLVSERLRMLLERFALPLHRFYPVPMIYRNKPVDGYAWLQLPWQKLSSVEGTTRIDAEAAIRGAAECAKTDLFRVCCLYWPSLDESNFSYTPSQGNKCFVSEPLRREMLEAGITGVCFEPYPSGQSSAG